MTGLMGVRSWGRDGQGTPWLGSPPLPGRLGRVHKLQGGMGHGGGCGLERQPAERLQDCGQTERWGALVDGGGAAVSGGV